MQAELLMAGTVDTEQWKQCGMPILTDTQCDDERVERVLQALFPHFGEVFEEPWEATLALMHYLQIPVCTPFFAASGGQTVFGLNFSGCAGNAEVSAQVAAHFFDVWIGRNHQLVKDLLYENSGFLLDRPFKSEVPGFGPFFPTRAGYGLLYSTSASLDQYDDEEDPWQVPRLEIDVSVIEAYDDEELSLISSVLNEQMSSLPDNPPCMCQLCSPEFDLTFLERLPEFH